MAEGNGPTNDIDPAADELDASLEEEAHAESESEHPDSIWSRAFSLAVFSPLVIRGVLAIVLGLLIAAGYQLAGPLMRVVLPVGLIIYILTELWELWRDRKTEPVAPRRWATLIVAIVVAVLFIAAPVLVIAVLELIASIAFVFSGVSNLMDAWRSREDDGKWPWMTVKGLFLMGIGVLIFMFPENMLDFAVIFLIGIWIAGGTIAIVYGIRGDRQSYQSVEPSAMVMEWLSERDFSVEDRKALITKLFFEGEQRAQRVNRFAMLMAFSIIIATLGVLQDSTAVVIGAMLIAPLMTPIMALAAAIVMGWRRRVLQAGITIAAAVTGGILLAAIVALFAPVVGDALQSSQVISRTSPTLLDLLVAVTAGAAGAFALSRPDVSDSLPGVAIAVALVPPLAVVGVTLAAGDMAGVWGSFLLFMTNFVSIVLSASVVFVLVGFSPIFRLKEKSGEIRVALGTFAVIGLIIAVPLSITGQNLWTTAQTEQWTSAAVGVWLEDAGIEYTIDEVKVTENDIHVIVGTDSEDLPHIRDLSLMMAEEGVALPFTVTVHYVPEQTESLTYTADMAKEDGLASDDVETNLEQELLE